MRAKPIVMEEEYFARQEFECRAKIEEEKQKKLQVEERRRLQELHHMKCPKCGSQLLEIDYKSLKIDECSHCKGIWLDHKELEEVIKLEESGLSKLFSVFGN